MPDGVLHLFYTNIAATEYNSSVIQKDVNHRFVRCIDRADGEMSSVSQQRKTFQLERALTLPTHKTYGLIADLGLSINLKYMITVNSSVSDGIVNGSIGKLMEVQDAVDGEPEVLWLLFPNEQVGKKARQEYPHRFHHDWTPIFKTTKSFKVTDKSPITIMRKQFPLVPAEAITIHKSQGGTYEKIAVHLTKGEKIPNT